jgi:hypothetical protein
MEAQKSICNVICLFVLGFTSHRHSIEHIATFQLYLCRNTSGALPCIISGTNGHFSRTTEASWIVSLHERIHSPCRNSNPQRWGASGLKSTTLTTRPPLWFVSLDERRNKLFVCLSCFGMTHTTSILLFHTVI